MKRHLLIIAILGLAVTSVLGLQPTITPSLSVTEEYTDNLELTDDDTKDTFITAISPGLTLGLSSPNSEFSLLYEPSYVMYHEFSEYDTWRQLAELDYTHNFTPIIRLELTDRFVLTDELISDDDPTVRYGLDTYYENIAIIGLVYQFRGEDSFELRYNYSILENDSIYVSDTVDHTPSILLNCWLVPNDWSVQVEASYMVADMDREVAPYPRDFARGIGRLRLSKSLSRRFDVFGQYTHTFLDFDSDSLDYQIYDPSLGVEYTPSDNSLISVAAGYYIIDRDGRGDNETSFNLTSEINSIWEFRRSTLTLEGESGIDQRYQGAESLGFNIFYELGGSLTYQFLENFSGDVFGRYRNDKYIDLSPDRTDTQTRIGAGLTFEPLSWMSVRLEVNHRRMDSSRGGSTDGTDTALQNSDGVDYEENRGLLRITLVPSQPIRLSN